MSELHNNRMQQTAPLGDRAGNGGMDAAASCSPFRRAPAPLLIRGWADLKQREEAGAIRQ